jgi:nucleoside-diphosphate-sugar epimerase
MVRPGIAVVTGATGFLGRGLVRQLVDAGHAVRVYARTPVSRAHLSGSVEIFKGDITDRLSVRGAVRDAEVVFHLAAKLHINSPGRELVQEYERINVEGTRILAEESCAAGVKRMVYFSTICVYGPTTAGAVVNEDAPVLPCTLYARTKLEAESLVRGMQAPDGRPLGVVLRLAAVYGANMKGNYRRMAEGIRQGWFLPLGDGKNRRTLVHDDDAIRAALLAARHPHAAGRVFNVTDGAVHEFSEIVNTIARSVHRRPRRLRIPVVPVRSVAAAVDSARRCCGWHPLFVPLVDKVVEDVAVCGDRIQAQLGFVPSVSLHEGWRRTLHNWYPSSTV